MRWLKAVGWYITSVMGDRDYQNYVAHLRRRHPDAAVPTERDYWRQRYADAAANPRARCC